MLRQSCQLVRALKSCVCAFTVLLLTAVSAWAEAQPTKSLSVNGWRVQTNGGSVRIITKGLGCTCSSIASDMAHVLNDMGKLRVLPVLGHGSLQGVADVLYLEGIDLSIVQSDVLAYIKRNKIHANIQSRIRYVTKLYNSELHLLAGPKFKTVKDLEGQLVSYDVKGRGSFITAQTVFDAFGVKVKPVHLERDVAIRKVQKGEIAAAFVVTGKPAASIQRVKAKGGIHLIPIEFDPKLAETYLPSTLTHAEYPNLLKEGETVPTIAVGEVLAVYNWPSTHFRYKKLETFIDAFFTNFKEFLTPTRHRKWKEVNLAARVPGWTRFVPAQKKLEEMLKAQRPAATSDQRTLFAGFVQNFAGRKVSEGETAELFREFMKWRAKRK